MVKGNEESIHLDIYDLVKAFDSLWLDETMNDLYYTIKEDKRDDKVSLLDRSNENNNVGVKTLVG